VAAIARRLGATIPQVVFRFAFAVGMVALTGTSDRTHMQQDLAALDLAVTESDMVALERIR
jgi:diketogulonate reductase-like aldo/keto reductase